VVSRSMTANSASGFVSPPSQMQREYDTRPRRAGAAPYPSAFAFDFPQHPDEHRPQRPILLAVDQELGEGAGLWVGPELADPVHAARSRGASGRGGVRRGERGPRHRDVDVAGAPAQSGLMVGRLP